ncbi:hypothetical protein YASMINEVIRUS_86 [Yasminevirus sp. GU-2018]|uniref:Uncharacterized protein n=1 Tax=Yasminevirus sp. GU-2018 TaxID=2420051 RepID=A0A5K0U8G7_9VIRU|nr:hypothetical protein YASMINEVIRUS_86 [Yasminevirus sp. GU-2018]
MSTRDMSNDTFSDLGPIIKGSGITLVKYFTSFVKGTFKNVSSNEKFYAVKIILDIIGESSRFREAWSKTKHDKVILALLIGATVPEMLTSYDTSPKSYRAFLARYFSMSRDHQIIVRAGESFCRQCHSCDDLKKLEEGVGDTQFKKLTTKNTDNPESFDDTVSETSSNSSGNSSGSNSPAQSVIKISTSTNHFMKHSTQCSGSLQDCLRNNYKLFLANIKMFSKLYGKLYALSMIINIVRTRSVFRHIRPYLTSVFRSSLTMATMYFVAHSYLVMIERMEPPKKHHYHFGLIIGSVFLATMEERSRLGAICQFMMAIYVNMFLHYSTPKNLKIWRYLLYMVTLLSLKRRGVSRTMLSLI